MHNSSSTLTKTSTQVNNMNSKRIFCCKTTKPIKYDICGQLISPSGFLHHRRTFEYNVLIMITEGTLHITANGVPYSLDKGQYIFLKAGEEHFGHHPSDGKLSYLWVHFRSDCGFEAAENADDMYIFPEYSDATLSGRAYHLFQQLIELSLEEKIFSRSILDYTVSLILMELSQEYLYNSEKNKNRVSPVILASTEWIKGNYHRPFTVTELAEKMGYQADYFSSLFKRNMGITIVKYTNQLRIRTAKTLLMNYDITIKEAAYSCGFSDEKYFMKIFKQLEGITPSEFKANNNQRSFLVK